MYISPEQAQGSRGDDLDGRSDLYSLGIVMYEMLTGSPPFTSDKTIDLLIEHIQKPPRPIRLARPDLAVPEPLAALVMRLLQKKREMRPASAAALIEDLRRLEAAIPTLTPRIAPKPAPSIPAPTVPDAPRAGVMASSLPPLPTARAPYAAKPAEPIPQETGGSSYLGRAVLVILAAAIMGGFWYHSTHRPEAQIARHQAAAADFESKQLYPQAEQEYRAALQLDANNASLQAALGHTLLEEKKWDEAISTLRAATALQPDDAVAHNNLGVALQTAGNVAEAIPEFREAIRLKADYLEAHSNLGHALEKQNDLIGAIVEFREVMRIKPDDAEAHFHLGSAYYKQGNSNAAVDEYREAIRLQPGFALAHLSLGGVLYNRGEHEAGIEELRTAYSLSPDDPEIRAAYEKVLAR